jgi:tRNA pseudouridine55 synthase
MDGLLIIDKPMGLTSHDVVSRARRALGIKKIGHFGTLDPMATGVLILSVGKTTRFFDYYRDRVKVYEGVAQLGWNTDSYDATGQQVGERVPVDLNTMDLASVIGRFMGKIDQVPPVFSAKKKDGKPLYHYARNQIAVDIASSEVSIHDLQWRIEAPDRFWFSAVTSSGTYIRSLVYDIGQALGCGGHLAALRRTAIGEFTLDRAMSLERLTAYKPGETLGPAWEPMEKLLPEWTRITLSENGMRLARNGNALSSEDMTELIEGTKTDQCRIFDPSGCLLALGSLDLPTRVAKPFLVLA